MKNPDLMTEKAAAELIGMSTAFLRAGRLHGVLGNRTPAPPHMKLGRAVRYSRADLDRWLADRRVDRASASRPGAAA